MPDSIINEALREIEPVHAIVTRHEFFCELVARFGELAEEV